MNAIPGEARVITTARRVVHTPNWLKAIYAVLVAVTVIVIMALILAPEDPGNDVPAPGKSETNNSLPACAQEDDRHCYWDADTQGNGKGHDVVNQ